jgi:hypothetical protein
MRMQCCLPLVVAACGLLLGMLPSEQQNPHRRQPTWFLTPPKVNISEYSYMFLYVFFLMRFCIFHYGVNSQS